MSRLNFLGVSLISSLFCFFVYSQAGVSISRYKTKSSDGYYKFYDKTLALELSLERETPLIQAINEEENLSASFIPNNIASIEMGVYYNWISLTTSIGAIPEDSKFGKSQFFQFENRIFINKNFSTYFRYSTSKGFYLFKNSGFDPNDFNFEIIRGDTDSKLVGGYLYYFPNGKRYSFKSLFNPLEVQLKRAGSPIASIFLVRNSFNSSSPLLPDSFSNPNGVNYSRLILGISGGYGYNYVVFNRIYLSGMITVGINYSNNKIGNISNNEGLGANTHLLLGGGYNRPSMRIGLLLFSHSLIHPKNSNDTILSYSDTSLRFHFTYRFNIRNIKVFEKIDNILFFKFLKKKQPNNIIN